MSRQPAITVWDTQPGAGQAAPTTATQQQDTPQLGWSPPGLPVNRKETLVTSMLNIMPSETIIYVFH